MRWVALGAACVGCAAATGELDGDGLRFGAAVYGEMAGPDDGFGRPYHDLTLWLLPSGGCDTLQTLQTGLRAARDDVGFGGSTDAYCDTWVELWDAAWGGGPTTLMRVDLHAQPRGGGSAEQGYAFLDAEVSATWDEPVFDAAVARYPAATWQACAAEFEGGTPFAGDLAPARGGSLQVTRWRQDDTLHADLDIDFDGGMVSGAPRATYCPDALGWALDFGRGLED